jgi:signal transduction histidine kinase
LRVYSSEANHFKQEDVNFLTAIAHQGAIAIENALAYDALQKAEEQRTQFVRIVTHELRAPVTGTQSLLRVLLNNLAGDLTDQQVDILGRLNRRMDSLLVLINDLLSLAASRAVDLQQPLTPIGVQPILKAAIEQITEQAEEKHIALETDMPQGWLEIAATGDGLRRIFDNLLSNAVKYTLDGGNVNVQVWEEHPNVVIMIVDTGIGIPEDAIDRLGEEFFRAPNARQSGIIGTGLGLTASKQLVDYFQGSMRVESRVGRGTTIILEFPKSPHMHI